MSHGNASLTPTGRLRLARCVVDDGWPLRRAAERFGVSPTTAQRWATRYRVEGWAGMGDRSSRPGRCPHQLPARTEHRIMGLRVSRRWGPARIAYRLRLRVSTVSKVLARYQAPRLAWTDPATGCRVRAKPKPFRYEHKNPGDLVHVDIKKLGRIPDGGGHRFLGRVTGTPRSHRGYDYLHVAIDDMSRVAYVAAFNDERGTTCARFLLDAAAFFVGHGVRIERVLTDNARNYTMSHAFAAALSEIGARHQRTRRRRRDGRNGPVGTTVESDDDQPGVRLVARCPDVRRACRAPLERPGRGGRQTRGPLAARRDAARRRRRR